MEVLNQDLAQQPESKMMPQDTLRYLAEELAKINLHESRDLAGALGDAVFSIKFLMPHLMGLKITEQENPIEEIKKQKNETRGRFLSGLWITSIELSSGRLFNYCSENSEKYPEIEASRPGFKKFKYSQSGKLVRDFSLESVLEEDAEAKVDYKYLDGNEFKKALFDKFHEEVLELVEALGNEAELIAEMADCLEVVEGIMFLMDNLQANHYKGVSSPFAKRVLNVVQYKINEIEYLIRQQEKKS